MTSFSPIEFLELAVIINESYKTPAGYRNVVGRAYYAAFLFARDKANISSKVQDGHKKVVAHYKDKTNPKLAAIGNRLDDLRVSRKSADYDCEYETGRRQAGLALHQSRSVFESLKDLKT